MYTLEEIEQEAKAYKLKYWRWCFVISLLLAAFFIFLLMPAMIDSYKPHGDNFFVYASIISVIVVIILIMILPERAYNYMKKQLEEENASEENQKREDHYKRMEELLEKLSEQREKV